MASFPFLAALILTLSQVMAAAEVEFATAPISRVGEVAGDDEYRLKVPLDTETLQSKSLLVTRYIIYTSVCIRYIFRG